MGRRFRWGVCDERAWEYSDADLGDFADAYREINSRKMFWIVMVLSVVVIGVFSAVGATNDGLSVLWWDVPGEWPNARH